ncbi:MAG: hypothetical protein H8D35_00895 [Nitrosopumilus sp.]|nr:hypothetical protein [Nitrosopumilus sp.]
MTEKSEPDKILDSQKTPIKKKKKPEAADADDSFDYDQGYNIEEVYDQ